MIEVTAVVTGDKATAAHLSALPANVRKELTTAMLRITIDLQSYVVRNKLSGQLLKRRTGTLAASIQHRVDSARADGVYGVVGSRINEGHPLKYAGPLEDGFEGDVTVKEHLRQMTKAWGREVKNPRKITVHAHTAKRHIKAYRYLASALEERRTSYLEQIRAAVARGAAK
jgi:hypothetical protein